MERKDTEGVLQSVRNHLIPNKSSLLIDRHTSIKMTTAETINKWAIPLSSDRIGERLNKWCTSTRVHPISSHGPSVR